MVRGSDFGASSNLMEWYGSTGIAVSSCTIANSIWAVANDGKVYYGGAELITDLSKTRTESAGPSSQNLNGGSVLAVEMNNVTAGRWRVILAGRSTNSDSANKSGTF